MNKVVFCVLTMILSHFAVGMDIDGTTKDSKQKKARFTAKTDLQLKITQATYNIEFCTKDDERIKRKHITCYSGNIQDPGKDDEVNTVSIQMSRFINHDQEIYCGHFINNKSSKSDMLSAIALAFSGATYDGKYGILLTNENNENDVKFVELDNQQARSFLDRSSMRIVRNTMDELWDAYWSSPEYKEEYKESLLILSVVGTVAILGLGSLLFIIVRYAQKNLA